MTGIVTDSETGRPVPAVVVLTSAVQFCGQYSDSVGHFRLTVPPGIQRIGSRARFGFHEAESQEVALAPGDSTQLFFVLPRDPDYRKEPPALIPGYPPAPWPDYFYGTSLDELLKVAGLARLDHMMLPEGQREIRVWRTLGFAVPDQLTIVREAHGRVEGEAVLYWNQPADETDSLDYDLTARFGPTCKRIERGVRWVVCYSRLSSDSDWAGLLADAETAQVWQLPDPFALYEAWRALDGWSMTVELRDGSVYRSFEYSNPDAHDWPETRQALVLVEIFSRPWQWTSHSGSPTK